VSDILFDLIDDGDVTATVVAASEDVTVVTVAGPAGPAGPPGVDDATVVHKVGNETVAGNKTFVGEFAVTTFGLIRNLYVAPPHPGDSARFVLDNENGQAWENRRVHHQHHHQLHVAAAGHERQQGHRPRDSHRGDGRGDEGVRRHPPARTSHRHLDRDGGADHLRHQLYLRVHRDEHLETGGADNMVKEPTCL
jgi:hypothetical protein